MSSTPKCSVCKVNEAKGVYASRIAPVSLAYCESCLRKGAESYGVLVTKIASIKTTNPDLKLTPKYEIILAATLDITGHTKEEFEKDVTTKMMEFLNKSV